MNNPILGVLSLILLAPHGHAEEADIFYPLPPNAIRLSGYLEEPIRRSIHNWNKGKVPYEKFVEMFRSGRKQFALGEMWGKAVRSGCMFYRYTQDPELKRILSATVKDLLTTQRPNGTFSCVPPEKQPDGAGGDLWERKYVLLGLEGYYDHVEKDPAVLKAIRAQADGVLQQIHLLGKVKRIVDFGWSPNNIESSTLLEPVMWLYQRTSEQKYLDFCSYIMAEGGAKGFNLFDQAYQNVEPMRMGGSYPKAYEMTSLFEGVADYYREYRTEYLKQVVINYYQNVREKEITVIGNGGGDQPYHPYVAGEAWDNTAVEQANPRMTRMMETCTGVTWMKYCSHILRLTGRCSAADDIEKYVYNGLLGAMKPAGDGFSYVNLLNGPKTTNQGWGWDFDGLRVTCCNLNGPMGLAYIPYIAVMDSKQGPVINLFNAASVDMMTPGQQPLKLEIDTAFPKSDKVVVSVNPSRAEKFLIRVRIPEWSARSILKVNGKTVRVKAGTYAEMQRVWQAGDKIELTLDMVCRVVAAPRGVNREADNKQALIWGPMVLARDENIDPEYDQPVSLVSKDGIVAVIMEPPSRSGTRLQFQVPTRNGVIHMVDYSSADSWGGKRVCTWMPEGD